MLVSILEPEVQVELRAGALRCVRGGEVLRVLQPHHVDALHLHGTATLTGPARRVLLQHATDVVFLTRDGRFLGRLVGPVPSRADRRVDQLRCVLDEPRRLALARDVVVGKLRNQRRVLMARGIKATAPSVAGIDQALATARDAAGLDPLRGAEGWGARSYFSGWPELLRRDDLTFTGRNRHPPRDPINAMLSYGYTLLVARVEHAVRVAGLDPYVGVLHEVGRGAPALALDLAEAWRPLVDAVVLTLVNRRQVGPEDFREPPEVEDAQGPVVWMDRTARTILIRAWEARLRTLLRHPVTGDRWLARELIREQATQIGQAFGAAEPRYHSVAFGGDG